MENILTTIATFLIILSTIPIRGLDRDNWGTHFVLTFLAYNDTDIKNKIVITARENVNVSVIFHETNTEHYIELAAGTSQIIPYDDNTTVGPFHQVLSKKAVSVESSNSVSVYGMVRSKNYGDGFLVLPVMALGIEYITVNCNSTRGSQIAIAAVEDSTNVTINLKPWQYNHCKMYQNQTLNNSDITFVLSSYDVIQMYCEMDLTGSLITSTKPVAVITGCSCGRRAGIFHTYDYMNEMIPPTSNFGNHHIIVKPEEHNVIFRIVTSAFTLVTIKNDTHTVEPREFLDIQANGSAEIISTQSVLVVMYMVGSTGTSSSVGGPLMMIIPPTNRYTTHYVVNTAVNKLYSNYSIIIANSSTYTQFTQPHFNGEYFTYTQLPIALQHVIVDTPYQYDIHPLTDTILNIKASSPVCFLVYSVAESTGIGYPGGMNISDFSGQNECQCNPCHNNGWCLEVGDGYRCRCTQHFTGPNCGEEVSTSTSIMNTTVITSFTTMTTTYNHTTDNTSLSNTTATTSITIDITTPNTTEITNLNTTTSPNTTEITTPNTTEMTTSNATTTSYTTEMTTLNTTEVTIFNTTVMTTPNATGMTTFNTEMTTPNTTEMTTSNTTEMTTPNTTEMTTSNTTEITTTNTTEITTTNTPEMTTSNTTQMTTPNTTEMTTPNTTEITTTNIPEMTTSNTTQMTTPNTTEMTTPNTTEITTTNTPEMTTSNTTQMTTPNTTEMTTPNTTEITTTNNTEMTTSNITQMTTSNTTEMTSPNTTGMTTPNNTEMTTYSGFDPTQGTVATQETINDTASSDSTTEANINQTDITSSSTTHNESHNTSETEISTASANVTINTTAAGPNITIEGITPESKYTTTENTDQHQLIDSTYMCSVNDISTNPNLTNLYLKCNDTLYWCNCPCPLNDSYVDLLERLTSQYQRLLVLDAELLGKTIRKKTSAINYHDSHAYLGVSSVGITLIFLSSVVLLDLTNLLKWCCERYKGQKVRFVRKRRPF